MKKISLLIVTVILNLALFSCTTDNDSEAFYDKTPTEQATGDDEEEILPPPPPPAPPTEDPGN